MIIAVEFWLPQDLINILIPKHINLRISQSQDLALLARWALFGPGGRYRRIRPNERVILTRPDDLTFAEIRGSQPS